MPWPPGSWGERPDGVYIGYDWFSEVREIEGVSGEEALAGLFDVAVCPGLPAEGWVLLVDSNLFGTERADELAEMAA